MVPVSPCDSAKGFIFVEGPALNSIHYHSCLQIMLWQIRNSPYCLFSNDFNRTGICSCRSHCSIFIEKWKRVLAAFVISDEIHCVDFKTTNNNLCHSQEGCNFITYTRTSRLMYRLRSTCILVFRSSVRRTNVLIISYRNRQCQQAQQLFHIDEVILHLIVRAMPSSCWSDLWFVQLKCSYPWLPSL